MPEKDTAVVIERIEGLKELINSKFADNKEEHQEIIKHQKETNGNVRDNKDWILENGGSVENLIKDRESKFRRLSDLAWKFGTALLAGGLGINSLLN